MLYAEGAGYLSGNFDPRRYEIAALDAEQGLWLGQVERPARIWGALEVLRADVQRLLNLEAFEVPDPHLGQEIFEVLGCLEVLPQHPQQKHAALTKPSSDEAVC